MIASFDEIEEKRKLAKEKVPLMKEYKEMANKKIQQFIDKLKVVSNSVTTPESEEGEEDDEQ